MAAAYPCHSRNSGKSADEPPTSRTVSSIQESTIPNVLEIPTHPKFQQKKRFVYTVVMQMHKTLKIIQ